MNEDKQRLIRELYKELLNSVRDLQKMIEHKRIEMKHVRLDCEHPDKYSTNTWGRDPGGAYCPDCGESW